MARCPFFASKLTLLPAGIDGHGDFGPPTGAYGRCRTTFDISSAAIGRRRHFAMALSSLVSFKNGHMAFSFSISYATSLFLSPVIKPRACSHASRRRFSGVEGVLSLSARCTSFLMHYYRRRAPSL